MFKDIDDVAKAEQFTGDDLSTLLEEARATLASEPDRDDYETDAEHAGAVEEWGESEEVEEARRTVEALEEVENDFSSDTEFIREDCFHDYIVQLVEDCYEIKSGWPYYIDWNRVVSDARHDYGMLPIGGDDFYTRG
jgi:hypothetical protein